jgi:integrase/recombinase XerD
VNLSEALDIYSNSKRSREKPVARPSAILRSFGRRVGNMALCDIREVHIETFLNGPLTGLSTWRSKYFALYRFFEYWQAREKISGFVMPGARGGGRTTFLPYIYSRAELRRLIREIPNTQKGCSVDVDTFRTTLFFLYGTGAFVSEVLRLRCKDVNLKSKQVTLYSEKFALGRMLPIGDDLCKILRLYSKGHNSGSDPNGFFLRTCGGKRIESSILSARFRKIRIACGVSRSGGSRLQPRLHDLRHTFAVHRLTTWLKHGANMHQMIPILSAYLGQVGLASAERYLQLTPERFRTQLKLLSPRSGKRRWRDDPILMRFLDQL